MATGEKMPSDGDSASGQKKILLRLRHELWTEIAHWAEDDLRSINGQIEFILTEAVKKRKKKQNS